MQAAEIRTFLDTAARFAKKEIAPMVGTEGRDGRLEKLPALMDSAADIGLLASPDPKSAGYDYGVWGRASLSEGPGLSVGILQEVAASCAGVAACMHFAGLGAAELEQPAKAAKTVAVALFEDSWRLETAALNSPPPFCLRISHEENKIILTGEKSLAPAAPDCNGYVVYGSGNSGWERVFVPAGAAGLSIIDSGLRTGLAALKVASLNFDRVALAADYGLPGRDPSAFLRRLFLGIAAIAAGNADAAVCEAVAYAKDRYQGKTKIINHAAVQILLGDAASRVSAAKAHLAAVCEQDRDDASSLFRAAAAKLRVTLDCWQAVTDSLQTLGGYGYMEDYRLEKRLRDAMSLKVMAVRPDDLRMFCAGFKAGEGQ